MPVRIFDVHKNWLANSNGNFLALLKFDAVELLQYTIYLKTSKDFYYCEKIEILSENDLKVDLDERTLWVRDRDYGIEGELLIQGAKILDALALKSCYCYTFMDVASRVVRGDGDLILMGSKRRDFPFLLLHENVDRYAVLISPRIRW